MEPKVEAMRRPNCHRSAAWGPALALPYRADQQKSGAAKLMLPCRGMSPH